MSERAPKPASLNRKDAGTPPSQVTEQGLTDTLQALKRWNPKDKKAMERAIADFAKAEATVKDPVQAEMVPPSSKRPA